MNLRYVILIPMSKKKIKELLTPEEAESVFAFHDIAEEVLGDRLEKVMIFGRTANKSVPGEIDVLFLLSEMNSEDSDEINQIAEDLSEHATTQLSPFVMDQATYDGYKEENHPIIHDIETTGVEITLN